jgi:hypothetical protein
MDARFHPDLEAYTTPKSYPAWFSAADRCQFVRWHRLRTVQAFLAQAERDTRPVLWMRAWAALHVGWHAVRSASRGLSGQHDTDPEAARRAAREAKRERERIALLHRIDDRYRRETGAPQLDRGDGPSLNNEDR